MDPVTLAALISLVGAGTGALASKNATDVGAAGLGFQEQNAAQAQRLGTAGHTDAYGDTETYDPASNTWKTTLSPEQQAITNATQSEQLKSLNQDAARNRAIKTMQYNMAGQAGTDYNNALAGFRYDQPASQGAIQDKLMTLMTNADNASANSNESASARELLRQGRGGDLANLIKTVQDNKGKAVATDALNAYQGSLNEEGQLQQQHQSQYLPALQQAASTVAAAGGAPVDTSSIAPLLASGQQQDSAGALSSVLQSGQGVGNAYTALAQLTQKGAPNLTGIANLYKAALTQPKTTNATSTAGTPGSSSFSDPSQNAQDEFEYMGF